MAKYLYYRHIGSIKVFLMLDDCDLSTASNHNDGKRELVATFAPTDSGYAAFHCFKAGLTPGDEVFDYDAQRYDKGTLGQLMRKG